MSLIVAIGRNRVIGTDSGLPWHLPRDLKQFRALTTGKPIILGRRTFEHVGRPLPDRANIVLTHRTDFVPQGILIAHSVDEALAVAQREAERLSTGEVFVIGGGEVYRAFLPHTDRFYITVVDGVFEGTTYFPAERLDWLNFAVTTTQHHQADEKNPHPYTFWQLDRRAGQSAASRMHEGQHEESQEMCGLMSSLGVPFADLRAFVVNSSLRFTA